MTQTLRNLLVMQETWVASLGQKDPLEKKMAAHSSILDWRIPWIEESGGQQSMESQRVEHKRAINTFNTMGPDAMILVFFFFLILSFKPAFSLSSFVLMKRLFSCSSLSAIIVVSYVKLNLPIHPTPSPW